MDFRKRFRRRMFLFLGLFLLSGVLLAPMILAKTPLKHRILPMLLPEYAGEITTGSASLMWWSAVELSDVQFYDAQGEPILHIEQITSQKSLAALLADQIRVGGFKIDRPHLKIRVTEQGSNLEEMIAPFLEPVENPQGMDADFHIRDGVIEIVDTATNRRSELQQVKADVRYPLDPAAPVIVRGAAEVQNSAGTGSTGQLDFDVSYRWLTNSENAASGEMGTLRLKTKDLQLENLAAICGRVEKTWNITGVVVSDLSAEWTLGEELTAFKLQGGLNATNFSLAAPKLLGRDRLRVEYLTHQGQIEYQAGQVHFTDLAIKSDVLTCEAQGAINPAQIGTAWDPGSQRTGGFPSQRRSQHRPHCQDASRNA